MPGSALEAVAGDWSRDLGGDRSSGRLPRPIHGLSSSPSSHTGIVSDVPGRLSSGSSLAARGRGDACQRSLRNRPRSGSRLLQSPLPGGEGDWWLEACDRPLIFERLRPAGVVQDGNSRFGAVVCQRGGFSSFLGSEGCSALAVCEVPRYDHRYQCRQGFPVSSQSREIPFGSGEILFHAVSPGPALAGDSRSPGFA